MEEKNLFHLGLSWVVLPQGAKTIVCAPCRYFRRFLTRKNQKENERTTKLSWRHHGGKKEKRMTKTWRDEEPKNGRIEEHKKRTTTGHHRTILFQLRLATTSTTTTTVMTTKAHGNWNSASYVRWNNSASRKTGNWRKDPDELWGALADSLPSTIWFSR